MVVVGVRYDGMLSRSGIYLPGAIKQSFCPDSRLRGRLGVGVGDEGAARGC